MELPEWLKGVLIFGPILTLFVLGSWLALRSGGVSLNSGQGMRRLAENLSQTILHLVTWVIGLAVVQQFIGFRMGMNW